MTGDALGGNQFYIGSATLQVPLGLPQEIGIAGRVFSDFGALWNVDATSNSTSSVDNSSAIRVSAGIGVSWRSPLGPVRLDAARPIKKEDFDKSELFRVSFGTRF